MLDSMINGGISGDESGGNLKESSVKAVEVRCEERKSCRKLGDVDGGTIQMDSEGLHQRKRTVGGGSIRQSYTEAWSNIDPHQSRSNMRAKNNKKNGN